jgi:molecular chaperone DnaK
VSRIKAAREALEQAFYKISEAIYRQGAATGAYSSGSDSDDGASQGPQDDTIEGEYKEM